MPNTSTHSPKTCLISQVQVKDIIIVAADKVCCMYSEHFYIFTVSAKAVSETFKVFTSYIITYLPDRNYELSFTSLNHFLCPVSISVNSSMYIMHHNTASYNQYKTTQSPLSYSLDYQITSLTEHQPLLNRLHITHPPRFTHPIQPSRDVPPRTPILPILPTILPKTPKLSPRRPFKESPTIPPSLQLATVAKTIQEAAQNVLMSVVVVSKSRRERNTILCSLIPTILHYVFIPVSFLV
jgi:hypothetical protein